MKEKNNNRFWEIDFLRGIAIIMMIIFHFLYDLNFFGIYHLQLYSGNILFFLYSIGLIFLLLVGISLTLSYNKAKKIFNEKQLILKFLKRGSKIFILGLIITVVTWIYLKNGFIIFGVLHCIGISIIVSYPLLKYRFLNLIIGLIFIILGIILNFFTFSFNWLLWLGFTPYQFYTVDYFPLLPWLGVVLIGIFLGNSLYPNSESKFKLKKLDRFKIIRFCCFLGRHSLLIYFLHQPILFTIFYMYHWF